MTDSYGPAATRYLESLVEAMGLDSDVLTRSGVSWAPREERRDTGVLTPYWVGEHVVLWGDPLVEAAMAELIGSDRSLTEAELTAWGAERGFEVIGGAMMKTLDRGLRPVELPAGATLARFDIDDPDHHQLLADLIEISSEEDLDQAEVGLDQIDANAVMLLDGDGRIGAYASWRPWGYENRFCDIGVITRDDCRGKGWGAAVVSELVSSTMGDRQPLYRCDIDNIGSHKVSERLGFDVTVRLLAVQVGEQSVAPYRWRGGGTMADGADSGPGTGRFAG